MLFCASIYHGVYPLPEEGGVFFCQREGHGYFPLSARETMKPLSCASSVS